METRTTATITAALAAVLSLFLVAGCTSSDDTTSQTGAGTAAAPAADSAGDAPAAGGPANTPSNIVEELYVDVEAEPDEGAPPLAVQFTAEVEDNSGAVECEWDFKDGSPKGSGLNPMHVFSEINDYEVYVLCRDSQGVEGEAEIDIFVEEE